jgi:hypothetical protein
LKYLLFHHHLLHQVVLIHILLHHHRLNKLLMNLKYYLLNLLHLLHQYLLGLVFLEPMHFLLQLQLHHLLLQH